MSLRDSYNEDREYSDFYLKDHISKLEKQLSLGRKKLRDLNKVELIQKLSIIKELIKKYDTLNLICSEGEDYQDIIDEYISYEQKLEEILEKYDFKKHNDTEEAKSWQEFKEEENYRD